MTCSLQIGNPVRLPARRAERGLSLVELMIAMAIGLVVVAALTKLFVDLSRANQEMAKTNGQIESARFAMQFLRNDIVHAGYWGGFIPDFDTLILNTAAPDDEPTLVPDPCLPFSTPWSGPYVDALLGIPVQVYGAGVAVDSCGAGVIDDRLAGTDALVVRHAETCAPGDANCDADVAGALYLQVSNCEAEIDAGFPYTLGTTNFGRYQRDCDGASGSPPTFTSGTVAPKRKFIQTIYYIRDYAATPGDDIPTLVRSRLDFDGANLAHQAAQALVPGIEGFRVELGIDNWSETNEPVDYDAIVDWDVDDVWDTATNRGDGVPDGSFLHCDSAAVCTAAVLTDVVAVKIYLVARAVESTPAYTDTKTYALSSDGSVTLGPLNDAFKRHQFNATMRLYNVAGRRETR